MSLSTNLQQHVESLAVTPRHRAISGSRERARAYASNVLRDAGWEVTTHDYRTSSSLLRTSDYGRKWWPAGAGGPIQGSNIIGHRGDPEGAVWIMAHLDTVQASPGADDNASGVAVALEVARHLSAPGCAIVLTDNEESAMLGARRLVREGPRPGLVMNLESVGYFPG